MTAYGSRGYRGRMDRARDLIEKLKALKDREGLSFTELGQLIGLHPVTLKDWLRPNARDRSQPSALAAAAVRRLLRRYDRKGKAGAVPREPWRCPSCADRRKIVELELLRDTAAGAPVFSCPTCGAVYAELRGRSGVALRLMEAVKE